MSDSESDPLKSLLSSFALGPSWARATGDNRESAPQKSFPAGDDRPRRRDDRDDRGGRDGGNRDRGGRDGGGERRPFQNRERRFEERPQREEEAGPEPGVDVSIVPHAPAVHLIGKEIHQVARVYALFDVAKILLAEKSRVRAIFETREPHAPLIRGRREESLFLSREEAARHLWNSDKRAEYIVEETIEVDPPKGNFQAIARCGISGEWLGPVNFHAYQTNLRRLHRERFARMPFELYAAKVRTERGEEAVNAWLETQKTKTRWRIVGEEGDDAWMTDRAEAERAVATRCFDDAFEETRRADVSGDIAPKNISPTLLTSLKFAGTHARRHPATLIPAVCRAVEAEHLPVFKRQGKLHTGPARPHPLPLNSILAERPAQMVSWIRENPPAKLEGLWKSVLPERSTAPPSEYAADLFWLLHQGHILLYTDDTLMVQEVREAPAATEPGEGKKAKKKRNRKNKAGGGEGTAASEAAEATSEEPASEEPASEEPPREEPPREEPASEEPPSEEPAAEEPAAEKPPSEESASPASTEPEPEPELQSRPEPIKAPQPESAANSDSPTPSESLPAPAENPESLHPEPETPSPDQDSEKPHFTD